jgi:hypothetical protein
MPVHLCSIRKRIAVYIDPSRYSHERHQLEHEAIVPAPLSPMKTSVFTSRRISNGPGSSDATIIKLDDMKKRIMKKSVVSWLVRHKTQQNSLQKCSCRSVGLSLTSIHEAADTHDVMILYAKKADEQRTFVKFMSFLMNSNKFPPHAGFTS